MRGRVGDRADRLEAFDVIQVRVRQEDRRHGGRVIRESIDDLGRGCPRVYDDVRVSPYRISQSNWITRLKSP